MFSRLRKRPAGFTLIEMLIAVGLTGAIAAFGFNFYVSMHNTTLSQQDISDMQQASRSCLEEITNTLRMGGFKIDTAHVPFQVVADTLWVYYSNTKPMDTVMYYLTPNTVLGPSAPNGWKPKYLMKKVNSQAAGIFADVVNSIRYTAVDSATMTVSVTTQTPKADEAWKHNSGYRSYTSTGRVTIRNSYFQNIEK
ncbi:MAG: prepilin-type N-terminal cleavage/methylation domain-containing protein [candidate division Zixibacteria bacterium]|nr:prepilin-type N-terminal cleavage/methylation domain-containing protein [candidate division Zixibacteria bacterium]